MNEEKTLDEKTLEGVAGGGMPDLEISARELDTYTAFCMEFRRTNCNHCAKKHDCVYAEDNVYSWQAAYQKFNGSSTCPMKEEHP